MLDDLGAEEEKRLEEERQAAKSLAPLGQLLRTLKQEKEKRQRMAAL